MSQPGSAPSGSDKPGSDGHRDGVGVGTGSFGGVGVAGAQGTVGTAGGETEGQGKGDSVGAGGVGVFRHFGKGRLGSDGSGWSVTIVVWKFCALPLSVASKSPITLPRWVSSEASARSFLARVPVTSLMLPTRSPSC